MLSDFLPEIQAWLSQPRGSLLTVCMSVYVCEKASTCVSVKRKKLADNRLKTKHTTQHFLFACFTEFVSEDVLTTAPIFKLVTQQSQSISER